MPKDTKTLGNNKARACESLGFVHKKRLCQRFDTTSFVFSKLYFCEKYFFTMMKLPFINRIFPSYINKAPPPTITPPIMTAIIFDLYEGKIRFINGNFIIVKKYFSQK